MYPEETLALDALLSCGVNACTTFGSSAPFYVRSSDLGDPEVELYLPKTHYSEEHISAPRRCCAFKFLHALENYKVLLAHFLPRTGLTYNFFQKKVKNWLTMQ